eukprot:1762561-Amphidinium_carterae.1
MACTAVRRSSPPVLPAGRSVGPYRCHKLREAYPPAVAKRPKLKAACVHRLFFSANGLAGLSFSFVDGLFLGRRQSAFLWPVLPQLKHARPCRHRLGPLERPRLCRCHFLSGPSCLCSHPHPLPYQPPCLLGIWRWYQWVV